MANMDRPLQSVFLVRSEHLNHQGHLFGGDLMAEIDTVAFCFLRQAFGELDFVTRAAEFSFERPARLGDAITFIASPGEIGHTSVRVDVVGRVCGKRICGARMIYVNLGPDGRKAAVPRMRSARRGPANKDREAGPAAGAHGRAPAITERRR
jgi:acyl-CoA hydrolase